VIALRVGDVLQRLRAVDLLAVRRVLFVAFVIGLGLSITLSEAAMYALGVLWVWRLRDPAVRRAQDWWPRQLIEGMRRMPLDLQRAANFWA